MPEQVLRNAEESSMDSSRDSRNNGAVEEARALEGDSFVSSVTGEKPIKFQKGSVKGGLKKKGPLIAIVALLVIFAGLIFLAQSVMPFAIVNRLIEEYNTAGITSVLRADNILDTQLSTQKDSVFGLSSYQWDSLAENNILPLDYGGGTVLAYKVYPSLDNEWKVVHGTTPASPSVTDVLNQYSNNYSGFTFGRMSLVTIEEAMQDGNFKNPYTTASKTWRGGNAGWYDAGATLLESIRGFERSRYWYTNTHNLSSNLALSTKVLGYRNSLTTTAWNVVTGKRTLNQWLRDSMAGTKVGRVLNIKNSGNSFDRSFTENNLKLNAAALASGAASLANFTCTGLQMVNKAQNLIASIQNMQFTNLASGYMESVQKVQIGESDGRAMSSYNDGLVLNDDSGKNGMSSAGMAALMSGEVIDDQSESIQRINPENAMANLSHNSSGNVISNMLYGAATGISDIMSAITTCNTVASGLSILSTAITVAVGVATAGIGSIVSLAISSIVGTILQAAAGPLVDQLSRAILDWIWDNFAATVAQNVATEWLGEDLGNALISGGDLLLGAGHQIGSGTPASKAEVILYRQAQDRVIAEEAEYQRSIRSPFDTTSQYTFLGSMVYSLIPLATTSGAGTIIKNVSSIMTGSMSKILPTASAVAETNLVSGFGTCPALESIGAACDKFGRPYIISDRSAIDEITMDEAIRVTYNKGGITSMTPDANGTFTVVPNSNAERFLKYCSERASNFGAADASIIEDITNTEHASQWWRKIPLIGSLVGEIVDFAKGVFGNEQQVAWATGAYCVNSEENSCFWESEAKYYQAFFEDQRILENADKIEKSAGALALEKYHESHPLDQSFEGVLARYSGMTKDDVIATLDFIDALDYIANYHPETRLAFGEQTEDDKIFFEITEDEFNKFIATEPKYIVYDTLRNKTVLV